MTKTEMKLEKVNKEIAKLEATLTGNIEADENIFNSLTPLYKEANRLSAKCLEEIL